jgi:hypothetical protein
MFRLPTLHSFGYEALNADCLVGNHEGYKAKNGVFLPGLR